MNGNRGLEKVMKTEPLFGGCFGSRGGGVFGAFDLDVDLKDSGYLSVQFDGYFVQTTLLDGFFDVDHAAIDFDTLGSKSFLDIVVGNSTECLAVLTGFQIEVKGKSVNLFGDFFSSSLFSGFAFGTLGLEAGDKTLVGIGGFVGEALGDKTVAAIASLNSHEIGFCAEPFDLCCENNFHRCHG